MKYRFDHGVVIAYGDIDEAEAKAYWDRGVEKYGKSLSQVIAKPAEDNEEEVELEYIIHNTSFHRIRRVTGYLVGTLDRWNNGKRAEERDRQKHSVSDSHKQA
ncbi:MAG: anaerobic ribonucleoside-triphosphate reductase [Clostridia bacterium]|nr:anaerobic ribonucleoside-triphosphate reductase [Clostridia bacterium]